MIRTAVLRKYDWPLPQSPAQRRRRVLGELCRQQRLRLAPYDERVKLNADIEAESAEAPRRGYSEPPLGADPAEAESARPGFSELRSLLAGL